MPDSDLPQLLRASADRRQVDDWSLALASAGIEARIDEAPPGYALRVRATDWTHAGAVLAVYDAENAPREAALPDIAVDGSSYGAYVAAVLLAAFFAVTGPRGAGSVWFDRGAALASRIGAGELWRAVTALTLHADGAHILGNVVTLIIFGTSLCAVLGTGVGVWLMLLAGALGNALAAAVRGAPYGSVGASTSIFGAIGALAAIQFVRRRRGGAVSPWRAWMPVAAGLALLGFLGTSPEADVLAHLAGFLVGLALAIPALRALPLRRRLGVQAALSIGAGAAVLGCWWLALR